MQILNLMIVDVVAPLHIGHVSYESIRRGRVSIPIISEERGVEKSVIVSQSYWVLQPLIR